MQRAHIGVYFSVKPVQPPGLMDGILASGLRGAPVQEARGSKILPAVKRIEAVVGQFVAEYGEHLLLAEEIADIAAERERRLLGEENQRRVRLAIAAVALIDRHRQIEAEPFRRRVGMGVNLRLIGARQAVGGFQQLQLHLLGVALGELVRLEPGP